MEVFLLLHLFLLLQKLKPNSTYLVQLYHQTKGHISYVLDDCIHLTFFRFFLILVLSQFSFYFQQHVNQSNYDFIFSLTPGFALDTFILLDFSSVFLFFVFLYCSLWGSNCTICWKKLYNWKIFQFLQQDSSCRFLFHNLFLRWSFFDFCLEFCCFCLLNHHKKAHLSWLRLHRTFCDKPALKDFNFVWDTSFLLLFHHNLEIFLLRKILQS